MIILAIAKKLQMQIDDCDCDDFWCPSCPVPDDVLEGICKAITAEPFASFRGFACEFDKSIAKILKSILGAIQRTFSHVADALKLLFDRSK